MAGQMDIFQQAMNQGHSAAWDQLWERAAGFYRQALDEFPDNPQALTSLGLALIELQDYDQSLRCYQKAEKGLPDDPLPSEKIAQLCERMGKLDVAAQASLRAAELYLKSHDVNKAIENWDRVTRLDPENLQAHSRLAMVNERLGEKSKAVDEFLVIASLFQSSGSLEKARQAVEQALKIDPTDEEARQAMRLLRDYKPLPKPTRPHGSTAPILMSQVRQLQAPNSTQPELDPISQACQKALTVLAGMLFEVEEESEAAAGRRGLQSIMTGNTGSLNKPTDRSRYLLHLSQLVDFQTRGDIPQAAEALQRAMDVGLDHPAAFYDLGYLYAQVGRLESALRQLQNAVQNADFALGSRLLMGDLQRKKGLIKEASAEYLEALKLADVMLAPPEKAEELIQLYELLIESHHQQEDPRIQTRLCDNVHDILVRADWRSQLRRARQQLLPGHGEDGPPVALAEILTEARSSQVVELMAWIFDLSKHGYLHSAMEEAYRVVQFAPTYLALHSMMGELLVKEKDLQGAVTKFQVISRAYASRGEMQQAIRYSRRVVELAPTDLNARGKLIEQLIASGQIENALDEYEQLAEVHYNLADLNMARKTYMDALRAAQQSNVDRSLRIKLLHRVVDIDMQSLDWRKALRVLEQIRTLQPDDEDARMQIIQLNFRMGQEQQALAEMDNYLAYLNSTNQHQKLGLFLTNMVNEHPDNIPVRRRLADAYRQFGQFTEAILQLDTIGEMLMQAGDRTGAMQTIESIIALSPPNKAEYITLLRQLQNG
jgi:tetratricopeptide (TPR) repeat protein